MNLSTNEKKLRHLETFKRLINLGLTTVCLGLEIAIFAYWWQRCGTSRARAMCWKSLSMEWY